MARELYTKQEWVDLPEKATPITAESLLHIEEGIYSNSENMALKELYGDTEINLGRKAGTSIGTYSVAEGAENTSSGLYAHSEGYNTVASESSAHSEGSNTTASKDSAHAEGSDTTASGGSAHSEGSGTTASNYYAHSEGNDTKASGESAHSEGSGTKALSSSAHSEGYNTIAGFEQSPSVSQAAHSEGYNTVAAGVAAHAEGYGTKAGTTPVMAPHAEGGETTATGPYSHSENYKTTASGMAAHAEGYETQANSPMAHSEGCGTIASDTAQHAGGKYNVETSGAVVIGGGAADTTDSEGNTISNRKNIFVLDWEGNAVFAGDVTNGAGVSMNFLKSAIDEAKEIAEGASVAKVFDTKADLDEWLAVEGNSETLSVGQNIYIVETDTPDYWWDGTGLQELETGKITIEELGYDETMAILNAESEVA